VQLQQVNDAVDGFWRSVAEVKKNGCAEKVRRRGKRQQ